jgi:hypothetical protein
MGLGSKVLTISSALVTAVLIGVSILSAVQFDHLDAVYRHLFDRAKPESRNDDEAVQSLIQASRINGAVLAIAILTVFNFVTSIPGMVRNWGSSTSVVGPGRFGAIQFYLGLTYPGATLIAMASLSINVYNRFVGIMDNHSGNGLTKPDGSNFNLDEDLDEDEDIKERWEAAKTINIAMIIALVLGCVGVVVAIVIFALDAKSGFALTRKAYRTGAPGMRRFSGSHARTPGSSYLSSSSRASALLKNLRRRASLA